MTAACTKRLDQHCTKENNPIVFAPSSNQCMKGRCSLISIARSLVRQIRTVFRRTAGRTPAPYQPTVCFEGGTEGLRIRLHTLELFAEFRQEGSFPAESLIIPLAALADFEGRDSTIVELESSPCGNVTARWSDSGVPKIQEYDAQNLDDLRPFPDEPQTLVANDARLVKALHDAMQGTAPASERYGADKVQLRTSGEIVATDGQQLLLQSGFQFPWTKHVLIPRLGALACRELPTDQPVAIGSTALHVMLKVGPWSFYVPADVESRYPAVESVIPPPKSEFTCWQISKEDAVFLAKTLPRLPVDIEEHEAVTVDLNGRAMIRSRSRGQSQPTELTLDHSEVTGKPVRFRINRPFLMRALQLGFSQMQVINADSPALWQDTQRKYVVMLLGKEGAIPPAKDALRMSSAGAKSEAVPSQPAQETAEPTTPPPSQAASRSAEPAPVQRRRVHRNGTPRPKSAESLGDLITEASNLRTSLRDVLLRSNQLVRALQRQRKQARLVRSTLASLRQLEDVRD
jgi:hypothetical protein